MARSLFVLVACCGLLLTAGVAEAGRRGCRGGSCGVSYGSCANGSCSVAVTATPAPAVVTTPAPAPTTEAAVVAESGKPQVTTVSTGGRNFRGRLFSRRAR